MTEAAAHLAPQLAPDGILHLDSDNIFTPFKLSMATMSGWIDDSESFEMPPPSSTGPFDKTVDEIGVLAASLLKLQTSCFNALEQQIEVNRSLRADTQKLQKALDGSQEQQLKVNIFFLAEIQWLEKIVLERNTTPIGHVTDCGSSYMVAYHQEICDIELAGHHSFMEKQKAEGSSVGVLEAYNGASWSSNGGMFGQ
ncbi:hypothetical protein K439DRAFT_1567687 [Ramaria rubella]|nr:hypothetical protein K439DRAFT_1567687 [Ramaria rubella]